MFYPSLEIRWFRAGSLDEEGDVARRFAALPFPVDASGPEAGCLPEDAATWPEGWREDTYLRTAGRADIGIKLRREGGDAHARLEFKGRTEVLGAIEVGADIRGSLERWAKWSVPAGEAHPGLRDLLEAEGDPAVATVRKRRLQRVLRFTEGGEVHEVLDPSRAIDRGVAVELVRLEIGGSPWWGIGFEAFPDVRPAELDPVIRRVVGALPAGILTGASALGYPAWLLEREPPTSSGY